MGQYNLGFVAKTAGLVLMLVSLLPAGPPTRTASPDWEAGWPMTFIPNSGQWSPAWRFIGWSRGLKALFHQSGVQLRGGTLQSRPNSGGLELSFVRAREDLTPECPALSGASFNFVLGSDPESWRWGTMACSEVSYRQVWPGTDLKFLGGPGTLKYELRLKPGARISRAALRYKPIHGARIEADGSLRLRTPWGEFRDQRPSGYQMIQGERRQVRLRFVLLPSPEGEAYFGFEALSPVDKAHDLVIDPAVSYATFLGGPGDEQAPTAAAVNLALATDAQGNSYLAGTTDSSLFGHSEPARRGSNDVYLAEIGPTGELKSVTFLGGSADESLASIAVNAQGHAYLAGSTLSDDFPTTRGSFQIQRRGGLDIFVAALNLNHGFVFSTLLGGSGDDTVGDVGLHRQGRLFITGGTRSPDFPTTQPAFSQNDRGGSDVFLARLGPAGTQLEYSTTLSGGPEDDHVRSLSIGEEGKLWLLGDTFNGGFPESLSFQPGPGGADLFLLEWDIAAGEPTWSTTWGGSGDDLAGALTVDDEGILHVAAVTSSSDLDLSPDAVQPFHAGGTWDLVLAEFAPGSERPAYATYWGGAENDGGPLHRPSLAVSSSGGLHLAGTTWSHDFPVTEGEIADGQFPEAFYSYFDGSRHLGFSRVVGGAWSDLGLSLAIDARGAARLAGITASPDLALHRATQPAFGGGDLDAFLIELADPLASAVIVGLEQVDLARDVRVVNGDVVVRDAGQLRLKDGARHHGRGYQLKADSIVLHRQAVVDSNLIYNQLDNRGVVKGQELPGLSLPAIDQIPPFEPVVADLTSHPHVKVEAGSHLLLIAGRYREIEIGRGATLVLDGGLYETSSLRMKKGSRLLPHASVKLRVRGRFQSDEDCVIGALPNRNSSAPVLLAHVEGRDHEWGVDLGAANQIWGTFLAPTSGIRLKRSGRFRGALWGREIAIREGTIIELDSGFSMLNTTPNHPPAARDDHVSLNEDQSISIPVLANDSDPDGDRLIVSSVSSPANGTVAVLEQEILYTPEADFFGSDVFSYTVSDGRGGRARAMVGISVRPINDAPVLALQAEPEQGRAPLTVSFQAEAADVDGDILSLNWDFGDGTTARNTTSQQHQYLAPGRFPVVVTVSDGARETSAMVTIEVMNGLPPDPSAVAPPLDHSVASTPINALRFLYTGSNPVQREVDPVSISPRRAALLRGEVRDRFSQPATDVAVSVVGHPGWGSTRTRSDGVFDLVVEGGQELLLKFEKEGFLPGYRSVPVDWQSYHHVPQVVLMAPDPRANLVDFSAGSSSQIAQGGVVTDGDGTRQATVLLPPGVGAEMIMADGTRQPLQQAVIRATELTVGAAGPAALPGQLPPSSFYTYALALTADEALQAGAVSVEFSKPLALYVDNFLGFPVGIQVPLGNFDTHAGKWVPAESGRVIEILEVEQGLAVIDLEGAGMPASVEALQSIGINELERRQLAQLYNPGQSLWRVAIGHFSWWDLNWGWTAPFDAVYPLLEPLVDEAVKRVRGFCYAFGSLIECQNQTLAEALPLAGTGYTMHYRSDRVPDRKTERSFTIPLSGASVPDSLRAIELEVQVAGQFVRRTFAPEPNQSYQFEWDGRDVYGRVMQGQQQATVRVGYTYPGSYGDTRRFGEAPFGTITGSRTRTTLTLWSQIETDLGPLWDSRGTGFGGWTLNAHHSYDPIGRILYRGSGERHSIDNLPLQIDALAPGAFSQPRQLAAMPDGSLLVVDGVAGKVLRIAPDQEVSVFAGSGASFGPPGDGGPAPEARLVSPHGVALAPDGSVYISEAGAHRIRRVDEGGRITTFAGTGIPGATGDGGPASEAQFNLPLGLAVGPEGALYVADSNNHVVRRIGLDGIVSRVAGNGSVGTLGDGGPALQARLRGPSDVAVSSDGVLYIADEQADLVRRVSASGIITRFAGGKPDGFAEEGVPARQARLFNPRALALGRDGTLFLAEGDASLGENRVRQILPGGTIRTYAGAGPTGVSGDGGPARAAKLRNPQGLALGEDGTLYLSETGRIRAVRPHLPGFDGGGFSVAGQAGLEIYDFDAAGRHLATRSALSGETRISFEYDGSGRLARLTDHDGNQTLVERDGSGRAVAIRAPLGQRTLLQLDDQNYLVRVTAPDQRWTSFSYSSGGLLLSLSRPGGAVSRFGYDELGRLIEDTDPEGRVQTFTRTPLADGFEVRRQSAEGRQTRHVVRTLPSGAQELQISAGNGVPLVQVRETDGRNTLADPNGTRVVTAAQGDPRFGLQTAFAGDETLVTPSGLSSTIHIQRQVLWSDPAGETGLQQLNETVDVAGSRFEFTYQADLRQATLRSAEGRTQMFQFDGVGRLLSRAVPDRSALRLQYDAMGRGTAVRWESPSQVRQASLEYDSAGRVSRVTDALGTQVSFAYDPAGRVLEQVFPEDARILFGYSPSGNLASIQPPGRPAHRFVYSATGRLSQYQAPAIGAESNTINYHTDADGHLSRLERPDGEVLEFVRDGQGHVASLSTSRGSYAYQRDGAGQLTSVSTPEGDTTVIAYDGPLPSAFVQAGSVNGNVALTWSQRLLLQSQSVNGRSPIVFSYDRDGHMTAAGALNLTRDSATSLVVESHLGGVAETWSYNSFGEIASREVRFSGVPVLATNFTLDSLGRIVSKSETLNGESSRYDYQYDRLGRLVRVDRDGQQWLSLQLDLAGNATFYQRPDGSKMASYDGQDRLIEYGETQFVFDAAGDLVQELGPQGEIEYAYDALGHLRSVNLPGQRVDYMVDGLGRRIGRWVDGTLVQAFIYREGTRPVAELDASGQIRTEFIYASRLEVPDYMLRNGRTYRIIADSNGSPRLVIDVETGELVQRIDYDPLGRIVFDSNPGFQPFGFVGGILDPGTGLVLLGARDYDPRLGRFTTKDPLLFGGGDPNFYRYAFGDPVNLSDPEGLIIPVIVAGAIGGALINVGITVAVTWVTGGDVSGAMIANAAISGAIAGAFGSVGGAVGGTLTRYLTGRTVGALGRLINTGISGFGSLIGQHVANNLTGDDTVHPCVSGLAGGLGGASAAQAVSPGRNFNSLKQLLWQRTRLENILNLSTETGQRLGASTSLSTGLASALSNVVPFAF